MPGPEGIDLFAVDITERAARLSEFGALLSADERDRAAGFHFEPDRVRFVVMRGTLREVLGELMKRQPGDIDFAEDEYGKPSVPGGPEFSVSYSGGMGLIAVSNVPVGVDVEQVDAGKVTGDMVAEVFSPGEMESYPGAGKSEDTVAFFRAWVRKEAIVKAVGKGLSYPLRQVGSRLELDEFTAAYEGSQWWTRALAHWRPDYEAALTRAWKGKAPEITLLQKRTGSGG